MTPPLRKPGKYGVKWEPTYYVDKHPIRYCFVLLLAILFVLYGKFIRWCDR